MEEDTRKLNVTKVMAEDRKQWRQLISRRTPGPRSEKLGTVNDDDGDDNIQNTGTCLKFKANRFLYHVIYYL